MAVLYFDPAADAALTSLERDPGRPQLLAAVNGALDRLEDDPRSQSVRRRRFTNGLWCITVVGNDEEWALLWEPHPEDRDGVMIQYLGTTAF